MVTKMIKHNNPRCFERTVLLFQIDHTFSIICSMYFKVNLDQTPTGSRVSWTFNLHCRCVSQVNSWCPWGQSAAVPEEELEQREAISLVGSGQGGASGGVGGVLVSVWCWSEKRKRFICSRSGHPSPEVFSLKTGVQFSLDLWACNYL